VVPAGAALREHQVVPAVAVVEVRPLDQLVAGVDAPLLADQAAARRVELLEHDAAERGMAGPGVPDHVDQPVPAVRVVEERGVEAARTRVDRRRPRTGGRRGGRDVDVEVHERPGGAVHDRVDEPEHPVVVAERGRPDAARVRHAAQVEARRIGEHVPGRLPVRQVARVVQPDAREPLEGAVRDVVVGAHPDDRGVRVEAGQDRVAHGDRRRRGGGCGRGGGGGRVGRHRGRPSPELAWKAFSRGYPAGSAARNGPGGAPRGAGRFGPRGGGGAARADRARRGSPPTHLREGGPDGGSSQTVKPIPAATSREMSASPIATAVVSWPDLLGTSSKARHSADSPSIFAVSP
jgi:hypothetical protein